MKTSTLSLILGSAFLAGLLIGALLTYYRVWL